MRARGAAQALLTLVGLCALARVGEAGTFTTTLQPSPSGTLDTYLREDEANKNFGDEKELRLKATTNNQNRHPIIYIPLSGLSGRSILRASLTLSQVAGNNAQPIVAPIYPLTEDFDEDRVTWDTRRVDLLLLPVPWTQPGGTHAPYWSDRALIRNSTTGSTV
jgi:hypothetical protein